MPTPRLVVIGASAGGVEALVSVLSGLPPELAAPVVVVLHIPRDAPSALPGILDRAGPLPAVAAGDGEPLRAGTVYVAPADRHVVVAEGHVRLSSGPKENGHRPAIDPLFRSAALAYGRGAVGVVLSGSRDDGSAGLVAIVERGGTAVVQDPGTAIHPAMPTHALAHVPTAVVEPAAKIGAVLAALVRGPAPAGAGRGDELLTEETAVATTGRPSSVDIADATPSAFSCPDCHGVLFELPGEPAPRFRCRIGHAWSPASLADAQDDEQADALAAAQRALEEKVQLLDRLATATEGRGHRHSAQRFRDRADVARQQARALRELLVGDDGTT